MDNIRKLYQNNDYESFKKECLEKIEEFKFHEKEHWLFLREIYILLANIDKSYENEKYIWILYGLTKELPPNLQTITILKELTSINEELFIEDLGKNCFAYASTLTSNEAIKYYTLAMDSFEKNLLYTDNHIDLYKTYTTLAKLYEELSDWDNLTDINERITELQKISDYIDNLIFMLEDEFNEL